MPASTKTVHQVEKLKDLNEKQTPENIFHALWMEISCGILNPRERLIEHELCERFETSNHTVRQAFELLDRAGLIVRRPNRGVEIKALNNSELNDLYEIRILLQREGARKIDLSRKQELAEQLTEFNRLYATALKAEKLADVVNANDAFHLTTFDYCTNADLAALQRTYWLRSTAVISRALSERSTSNASLEDHESMIAAIKAGSFGLTLGAKRFATVPSRPIKNFSKFQRILSGLPVSAISFS
jgi:DNA-binding GntR family transcriptional regulator